MRFFSDGPAIPDELLEQRDRGNVVFLCGAGVSKPAGLPSFAELVPHVMDALGTPPEAKSRSLFGQPGGPANLDQVFNLLQEEYTRDEVERVVSRILATPKHANIEPHSIILRLSQSASRRPRVVTTNFDLLFERADKRLPVHIAPVLPDIAIAGSFDGIVYLHGRRQSGARLQRNVPHGLVLASADFGRAYLADGWATRFVRELLQTYFIVLVGYSASDPPVRYLLEGLHARKSGRTATIYAFDHGMEDEIVDRWRSLGVRALPYPVAHDSGHNALWDTLRSWAERADNAAVWRQSIVELSRRGPKVLAPYQRGQVASLVRTPEGASTFSSATPPPTADWLCVFDKYVRYAEVQTAFGEQEPDPLLVYGLDDDPRRPEPELGGVNTAVRAVGDDLLTISLSDESRDRYKRAVGMSKEHSDPLPSRLTHLAGWFGSVASDSTAIWWAAGYKTLHPQMLRAVEWHLQHAPHFNQFGRHAWRLLLERFRHSPEGRLDDGWYQFVSRLKQERWTGQVLRDFERAVQPYLTTRRPPSNRLYPPVTDGTEMRLKDVVDFEVAFPGYDREKLEIPTAILPTVFKIVRRALQRASNLLAEIETQYWRTSTFLPDDAPGERYLGDASKFFEWSRTLFDRLATEHIAAAREEVRQWPVDDAYFFDKFRIYAWMNPSVAYGQEVAVGLLGLSSDGFWEESYRRELLHTLRARWNELPKPARRKIERRIIAGRAPWKGEKPKDFRLRKKTTTVVMLEWLREHGCELSATSRNLIPKLQENIPNWRVSWVQGADHSLEGRVGFVATDSDPSILVDAPISIVIPLAERHSKEDVSAFTRTEPFRGLVEQRPARALLALRLEAQKGKHYPHFWRTLIAHWPNETSDRLLRVCAGRITHLPDAVLIELRYDVTRWFREHASSLAHKHPSVALQLFDRVVDSLFTGEDNATRSAIGDVTIGGKRMNRSRRTYEHAINSPIGNLAAGLLRILNAAKKKGGRGAPVEVVRRFERLMTTHGEGPDHVVVELARDLNWLFHIDPRWCRKHLLPLFDPQQRLAEPAWNGLLGSGRVPGPRLFTLLKPYFLQVFHVASGWRWEHDTAFNKMVEFLVVACYWKRRRSSYLTYDEARVALRTVDDAARAHAIWFLSTVVEEQHAWNTFGEHFIEKAWPRESRFRTAAVSRQLAFLAEQSGDQFADVVDAVRPLLVHVDQLDVTIHRTVTENQQKSLAARFPEATLKLLDSLIADDPKPVPFDLSAVLEVVADAYPNLIDDQRWRRLRRIVETGL